MKTTKTMNAQNATTKTTKAGIKTMNVQSEQTTKMLPIDIIDGMPTATEYDDSGKAITTKSDNIFEKDMLPFMTCADDLKDKTIGQLIKEYNKFGLNARIGILEQGGVLKKIKDSGAYKDMTKTFDAFLKEQGIAKATAYRYINGYKLCCDAFGKVKADVLSLGSAIVNKAEKIGFTRDGFQAVVEKAKADNIKLTADNITEIADKIGVTYDKDKAPKANAKKAMANSIETRPNVPENARRFLSHKGEMYFDMPFTQIVGLKDAERAEKALALYGELYGSTEGMSAVSMQLPKGIQGIIIITKSGTANLFTYRITKDDNKIITEIQKQLKEQVKTEKAKNAKPTK